MLGRSDSRPRRGRTGPIPMSSTRSFISYGWYVLAASFVILFVNAGARLMIGVFEKPMIAEFGWSRGAFSSVIFVNTTILAVAIVVTGHLYDRFGPKWVVLGSSLLFSGGLMLTAVMTSMWQFMLFYGVIAGAGLGGVAAPMFGAIVSRWFERARGTAISMAMAGGLWGSSCSSRCSPCTTCTWAGGARCSGRAC